MYRCYENPVQYNQLKNIDSFKKIKDGVYLYAYIFFFWPGLNLSSAITRVLTKTFHCIKYSIGGGGGGGFSTFNRKQWVRNEWPICSRDRIVPSSRLEWQDVKKSFILDWSCAVCLGDSCPTHFARVQWCNCSGVVSNQRKGCICLRRRHQGHP